MTAIAVTGAGGYVGGRLVAELRSRARLEVVPIVRSPVAWLGAGQRVAALDASVREVEAALDGCDVVVHLAGASEVVFAHDPPGATAATVAATRGVIAGAGARCRIVYVSTMHVYGSSIVDGATLDEETTAAPTAAYAAARLESERLLAARGTEGDVVFRLTNSVGPPAHPSVDRWTLVGNDLCRQAVTTGALVLKSAGLQYRDFVDLGDVAGILADTCEPGALAGGIYNLGSGIPRTVRWFAEAVQEQAERVLGSRPELVAPDPEAAAPTPYRVDVGKLAVAGHRARTPIEQSIAATLEFCAAHRTEL